MSPRSTASEPSACPWCSAALAPGATACPACGATLAAEPDLELPGLTSVVGADRQRRRPRRGFLGLLLGGTEPDEERPTGPSDPAR